MNYIVEELKSNGVQTLDHAVDYLIKNGYISVHHLYYPDIYAYFKALELNYKNMDKTGYKIKARDETCKHFKVSLRTFYRVIKRCQS